MNRDELFEKFLRSELSPSETAELKNLLERDDEAGRALVGYVNETNLLVRVAAQIESVRADQKIVPLRSPSVRPDFPWRRVALAACLMLCAALAFVLIRPRPSEMNSPQLLASDATVQLTRGDQVRPFQKTQGLKAGDVIITGLTTAVIAYDDENTRVEIHPDSVVQFAEAANGKRLELRQGSINARVAPQAAGRPMLIITPHARATVLGTELALRADAATTKLEVLEGQVQFTCRFNAKKVLVTTGHCSTADRSGPTPARPLP